MSTTSNSAPKVSSRHFSAFIRTRSTMPTKSASTPIGSLQHGGVGTKAIVDHLEAALKIGADAIHLVDEADPRHAVFVGLAPHRFRLRLDPGDRVEHRDRAVEHAQAALDLDREIHVARRVDDVDPVVEPKAGRRGRSDRDAAFLLLLHPVHRRGAFVHLADFVGAARIVENPLGGRRFTGIDVRHDADIAIPLERRRACHRSITPAGRPGAAPLDPEKDLSRH